MTIDKVKLDSLLEEAYAWIREFDDIQVRQPIQLLIQQMYRAIEVKDYTAAWLLIAQLNGLTDQIRGGLSAESREQSLIRVECALTAYRLGNLPETLRLLNRTLDLYDRRYGGHYEAVVTWMLGCVQWQTPDQKNNAITSWQKSVEIFQGLVYRSLDILNIRRSTWYSSRIAEMNSVLELALQPEEPPQPSAPGPSKVSMPDPPADAPESMPAVIPDGDFLRLFRVHTEVVAGSLDIPVSKPFGYVEINQFLIDGRAHYLVNLRRSGKVIKTVPGKQYDVVRVSGESMNAEGIEDGDYVLLRLQETAEHHDIVAAQIHSLDTVATLKKFLIEGNKFILRFRSKNQEYKKADGRDLEYQFDGYNHEKFEIVGVAIAVFKPLNDSR